MAAKSTVPFVGVDSEHLSKGAIERFPTEEFSQRSRPCNRIFRAPKANPGEIDVGEAGENLIVREI